MSEDALEVNPVMEIAAQTEEKPTLPNGYIPKDQRKKILLLSDDLRMPSGVGVMSREFVVGTAHRFNWVQVGAGINHPEVGRVMDASESLSKDLGIPDAYLKIYPYNGYGDHNIIRHLMQTERPDAILHFTDPRYWIWLYQMEGELRTQIPIMFYHVWDDLPFPRYNENYYRSCDFITCISRQTYNIVRNVWKKEPRPERWQVQYNPHGINPKVYRKLTDLEDLAGMGETRKMILGEDADNVDFVVLYNNRNIRRKMTGDVILAFQKFYHMLPKEKADRCRLVLHTHPVDENGTDLPRLIRDLAPEIKVSFSVQKVDPATMNRIYNNSDVVINLASNEGFGLGTLEAMMAERMIVANVTGGLQDQMGFKDDKGNYIHEDIHYGAEWGSNHDGRYKDHGKWVVPVFPNNRALNGSPPTPYIFDDRCDWNEAAEAIKKIYDMTPEERAENGRLGREYAMTQGFRAEDMCQRFIDGIEGTFKNWKPRKPFGIFKG